MAETYRYIHSSWPPTRDARRPARAGRGARAAPWCKLLACAPPPRTAQNAAPWRPAALVQVGWGESGALERTAHCQRHAIIGQRAQPATLAPPLLRPSVVHWDGGPAGRCTPLHFRCQAKERGGPLTSADPQPMGAPKGTALARQTPRPRRRSGPVSGPARCRPHLGEAPSRHAAIGRWCGRSTPLSGRPPTAGWCQRQANR